MMRKFLGLLLILLPLPAMAGTLDPNSVAYTQSDRYGLGHLAVEAQLGLGTPIGVGGLAFDLDLHRDVSINLGGGYGFGPQFAGMIRYRRGRPPMRWGFGIGTSRGNAGDLLLDTLRGTPTYGPHWSPGWWLNFELNLEARYENGLRWRCFLGGGAVVNISDCSWTSTDPRLNGAHCTKSFPLPYLGCAIGIGR